MPYVLSPRITLNSEVMWMEGAVYEKQSIYRIKDDQLPPVNYDLHKLRPHSITHAEGSLHVQNDGMSIEDYYKNPEYFYGSCVVVRLKGNKYTQLSDLRDVFHWEVSKDEIRESLQRVVGDSYKKVSKVILTTDFYPQIAGGYHNPNYILTLSLEAAEFLVSLECFNMFGTSWKSSDYAPNSIERPIHKTLLTKAVIFELLDLKNVPEGEYVFVGFPIRLEGSSESPVTPVLFNKGELK